MMERLPLIRLALAALAAALIVTSVVDAQSSPRLLVLNKEEATLAIVDPVSGKVLGRVPTGDGPHELVTSTDGKIAFASNYGTGPAPGHTISMIDIASQKELRRIDVAPLSRPHGLASAGGKLYFSAEANKKIARYDPTTNNVDWEFETGQNGTHMVLPAKDLRTIFTSNIASDSVSAVEQRADGACRRPSFQSGRDPKASTCRLTAASCGSLTRATAAYRSSTSQRGRSRRRSPSGRSDPTGSSSRPTGSSR